MSLVEWIALNSVSGLGPVRIKHLLDHFGTPEEFFRRSAAEIRRCGLVPDECCGRLSDPALFASAEKQLAIAEKTGMVVLSLTDKRYPLYLREIFAPPPILYVKGDLSVFSLHAVAVVGTRTPSLYGKNVTATLAKELTGHGLAIVSGLASGIDTIAHQTSIDTGGRTVAVLGCGIDHDYANRNPLLNEKIIATGAIISEFEPGTQPLPFNFPRRNRIISGLAAGTLVVEGTEKSGAMITAHYAVQQGRDVFAVPGPITSSLSRGPFSLLRQGAIPARSGCEIAAALSLIAHPGFRQPVASPVVTVPLNLLNGMERDVFDHLSSTPRRIDELADAVGTPIMQLFSVLLNLELKGLVRQISGAQYVRPEHLSGMERQTVARQ
ncbi:MAG: DNA-processing protein DprA [Chitinispirillaceae bacterium]|nr:DNA-processing protein DprA [Chitinispirillaceae bacterium]